MGLFFAAVLFGLILVTQIQIMAATTVSVLDGALSITDSEGTGSKNAEEKVTIKVTATTYSISGTTKNNTITITNETNLLADISFNYTVTGQSSISPLKSTENTYSVRLASGESMSINLEVKDSLDMSFSQKASTATLTLSGFTLVPVQSSTVTISCDSNLGSVTADGQDISSVDLGAGETTELTATAKSGSTFIGWIDVSDNSVESLDASFTCAPSASTHLRALFVNSSFPIFYGVGEAYAITTQDAYASLDKDGQLGGEYDDAYTYYRVTPLFIYDNWTDAMYKAQNSAYKGVVVLNNGTLPAGDYTVPSGVTLLIPFDIDHTMYTSVPGFVYSSDGGIGDNYRMLSLAPGAKITVEGAISISAPAHSADGGETAGYPWGDYGKIVMTSGSTITIKNGGALYAWGFVTGDSNGRGSIVAESGATIYENFQLADYRGGNQSSSMKNKVFASSQYYVQNIEVPLELQAGATENCCTWVNISSLHYHDTLTTVPFVKANGLFNITSGSITKYYDGTSDRLIVEFDGDVTISTVTLNIGGSTGSSQSVPISSNGFVLGINNNITLQLNSGTVTVGQDIALQPGSELIIHEGANCVLSGGVNAYVYDADEWGYYCFAGADYQFRPIKYAPSKQYTRSSADLIDARIQVDGTLDASSGYLYTTKGMANIYSTGTGVINMNSCTSTKTYQFSQVADTADGIAEKTYVDIPITSAKLKNMDGTYVATADKGTGTYYYVDGYWHLCTDQPVFSLRSDSLNHWYGCNTCGSEDRYGVEVHHFNEDNVCTICKYNPVQLVGRTLKYVDTINVICLFEFSDQIQLKDEDGNGVLDNAGLVTWTADPGTAYKAADGTPNGNLDLNMNLKAYPDSNYYYAEADGIKTPDLYKSAYYACYVIDEDGEYLYSEVFEYSPSMYAYNMINGNTSSTVTPETKALCVALLNYISAAQQYFGYDTAAGITVADADLVNASLNDTQKALSFSTLTSNESEIGSSALIFTRMGKNLYFDEKVNLAAMFQIKEETDLSDSGTIFWNSSQWAALNGATPTATSYGSGQKVALSSYNNASTIYFSMCPISIAPKDMASTKIYSMGYVNTALGYQYSSVKVYGIEDYIANTINEEVTEGTKEYYMKVLAQRLYEYEQAAQAALLNQ